MSDERIYVDEWRDEFYNHLPRVNTLQDACKCLAEKFMEYRERSIIIRPCAKPDGFAGWMVLIPLTTELLDDIGAAAMYASETLITKHACNARLLTRISIEEIEDEEGWPFTCLAAVWWKKRS